jgi:hypothetical protein
MHLSNVSGEYLGTAFNHGASASGTYPNRNHFAGMLNMTLAIGIGLLIAGLSERRAASWKEFLSDTIAWILSPKMILRLSLCILVIALTTTSFAYGKHFVLLRAVDRGRHRDRLVAKGNPEYGASAREPRHSRSRNRWQLVRRGQARPANRADDDAGRARTGGSGRLHPPVDKGLSDLWRRSGLVLHYLSALSAGKVREFFDYAHNDYAQITAEIGVVGIGLLGWSL